MERLLMVERLAIEPRPLDGIKVVELAQMIAAPSAGLLLADYGAEVVKIEPPGGDGCRHLKSPATRGLDQSPIFDAYNRGKTLLTLDLTAVAGREAAMALIADADILIESSRPGAMERLGFGADAILARFPRLVYATVSGFGQGPVGSRRGGVDMIVQAESGMMALTGESDGPPTRIGFTVIDAACGHVLCHGILAALIRRGQTGLGGRVQASLYDVALHLQTGPIAEFLATGEQAERSGNGSLLAAPANLYRCREGEVVLSAYLDPHWRRLAELIGDDALFDDPRFATASLRVEHRAALNDLLGQRLLERSAAEWVELFRGGGLLAGEVKTYRQVLADPVLAESRLIEKSGPNAGVRNPVRLIDARPVRGDGVSANASVG